MAPNLGKDQLGACQFYGLLNQKVSSYLPEDILVEPLCFLLVVSEKGDDWLADSTDRAFSVPGDFQGLEQAEGKTQKV